MRAGADPLTGQWFRSAAGRRYGRDFALLILIKIALLALLYAVVIAPQGRMDTSPAAMQARLFTPADKAAPADDDR